MSIRVHIQHLRPLHHHEISNTIENASSESTLVDTIKDLNVNALSTHQLTNDKERYRNGCTTRDNEIWTLFTQYLDCKSSVSDEIRDVSICRKVAMINALVI